jgi:hypothetical protein
MGKTAILGLSLALCGSAAAQVRVGVGHPSTGPVGMSGRHFGANIVVNPRGFNRPYRRYGYPYGYGYGLYGTPYYYSDDYGPSEADYRPEPAPQPAPVVQEKPEPLPDPVLLELHGNQWVKVGNFSEASQQALSSSSQTTSAKEIPPAVLIYRDGHSEEVSSYSIIGGVMYTKSDYYSSGNWTRTIQLADLDLPATLKQNQQRGVKFDLPAGPNEVVIRP